MDCLMSNQTKTKRIAYNSVILFIRMLIISLINLYAIRWVLKSLGVIDYGIFNAVAGIVLLGASVSGVLAMTTQRFYSYALGERREDKVAKIFSVSLNLVLILSVLIIVVLELVGPHFISTQMTIPTHRLNAALWVFHFSILSFVFSFAQIPFMGLVYAQEDMWIYALISMIECVLKLLLAIFVGKMMADHLQMYSIGLAVITFLSLLQYLFFSLKRYKNCRYVLVKEKNIYREFAVFSGWTLFGTIAGAAVIQGSAILLNTFFSPRVNSDYAIANQIYNALNMLVATVFIAFRPVMIKSYAEGNTPYLDKIFSLSNKVIYYMLLLVAIPVFFEMNTLLTFWLGQQAVTPNTVLFARLYLVYTVCMSLHNPITAIVHATGNIKQYCIIVESTMLLCLPLSWISYKMGAAPYMLFIALTILSIVGHALRLWVLKTVYHAFELSSYLCSFLIPACLITTGSYIAALCVHQTVEQPFLRFCLVSLGSIMVVGLLLYSFGLNNKEKQHLARLILKYKSK